MGRAHVLGLGWSQAHGPRPKGLGRPTWLRWESKNWENAEIYAFLGNALSTAHALLITVPNAPQYASTCVATMACAQCSAFVLVDLMKHRLQAWDLALLPILHVGLLSDSVSGLHLDRLASSEGTPRADKRDHGRGAGGGWRTRWKHRANTLAQNGAIEIRLQLCM